MTEPPTHLSVQARAVAAPGLLARLATVLNPHPVAGFDFAEAVDGTVTITVRLKHSQASRDQWHADRVAARLRRIVGVTSVDPSQP